EVTGVEDCVEGATGGQIVPGGTGLSDTAGADGFTLEAGADDAAGAPVVLCFEVTAGDGLQQGETGTASWEFTATSVEWPVVAPAHLAGPHRRRGPDDHRHRPHQRQRRARRLPGIPHRRPAGLRLRPSRLRSRRVHRLGGVRLRRHQLVAGDGAGRPLLLHAAARGGAGQHPPVLLRGAAAQQRPPERPGRHGRVHLDLGRHLRHPRMNIMESTASTTLRRSTLARIGDLLLTLLAVAGSLCIVLVILGWAFNVSLMMFRTGSMDPTIPAGSVAVVREIPAVEMQEGDVVTVDRGEGVLPVTHRVVAIEETDPASGQVSFEMRGDANDVDDPEPYTATEVRRVMFSVPGAARIIQWFGDPYVLGGLTLGATALVIWAFWPRERESQD